MKFIPRIPVTWHRAFNNVLFIFLCLNLVSNMTLLCAIAFLKSFIKNIMFSTSLPLESNAIFSPKSFDIFFLVFKSKVEIKFPNSPNVIISNIAQIGTLSSFFR